MFLRYLITFSLILTTTHISHALEEKVVNPPLFVIHQDDETEKAIFYSCYDMQDFENGNCEIHGNEKGYLAENIQFKTTLRKTRAIATGAVEVAIVAGGSLYVAGFILTPLFEIGSAIFGAFSGIGAISVPAGPGVISAAIAGLAAIGTPILATTVDALNPAYQWKLASELEKIDSRNWQGKTTVINFETFQDYESFINMVAPTIEILETNTQKKQNLKKRRMYKPH